MFDNPLTARVFVNRVWHWLFGAGLVATPNDFGQSGQLPSHPELLDYLAAQFVDHDWSVKRLIREILLSETWCQSQAADANADRVDPLNRLLHHYPLRRMNAESIRDGILRTSGSLATQLYGPPIDPHRPQGRPSEATLFGPAGWEWASIHLHQDHHHGTPSVSWQRSINRILRFQPANATSALRPFNRSCCSTTPLSSIKRCMGRSCARIHGRCRLRLPSM